MTVNNLQFRGVGLIARFDLMAFYSIDQLSAALLRTKTKIFDMKCKLIKPP